MTIVFCTSDVEPRHGVTYWREVVMEQLARHQFRSSVGPTFQGRVAMGMLGPVSVAHFACDPCEVGRTKRDLASCQKDEIAVCLQLRGKSVIVQDGREAVMQAGNFALLDTVRPCSVHLQDRIEWIVVSVPRQALEARLRRIEALTAQPLSAGRSVSGLTYEFLSLLPSRLDAIEPQAGETLAEHATDLIALSFALETKDGIALSSPRSSALLRLRAAVEARLCEPDLKPAAVAAQANISVRYANELLKQEGYSVERYILRRRLERCRRALEDPQQSHRSIGEIAFGWGFSDLSHFGRRFRAEYGCTPGDHRRRAQEEAVRRP
jgi:AraC-like DNA-binding protein